MAVHGIPQPLLMCWVQFAQSSAIRVGGVPSTPNGIVGTIRSAISSGWAQGLRNESEHSDTHEFKLKGMPWSSHSSDVDAIRSVDWVASLNFCQMFAFLCLKILHVTQELNDELKVRRSYFTWKLIALI